MNHLKSLGISVLLAVVIIAGLIFALNGDDNQSAQTAAESTPSNQSSSTVSDSDDSDVKEGLEQAQTPQEADDSTGDSLTPDPLDVPENSTGEALPVITNHFAIERGDRGEINVTLYAILNRPEQYDEYINQLTQYKQESLDYLSQNGISASTNTISFTPEGANGL